MYEVPENYISPYNLNERIKRLNRPGLPELPCICDPECMCFDLCAGDLTRNCLCEENGLFARITEGWDIDDLDIPDRDDARQMQFVNAGEFDQAQRSAADNMAPSSPTLNLAIQLSTMDRFQLKKLKRYFENVEGLQQNERNKSLLVWDIPKTSSDDHYLNWPQHERAIKPVAYSAIESQDIISRDSACQIASAVASSRLPISTASWDTAIFDVDRNSPMIQSRDRQATHTNSCDKEKNTLDHGRIRRSFSTLRSAFYRKFLKSKCFDRDLIDAMIRPSPFKMMPVDSMA